MFVDEDVNLHVRRIDRCGLYVRGGKKPEVNGIDELMPAFKTWTEGFDDWTDTKIREGRDGGNEGTVYVINCVARDGDYLVQTFNEASHDGGATLAMRVGTRVGDVHPSTTPIKDRHLPGHPAYFWIMPDEGLVAAVRVRRRASLGPWAMYMKTYLELHGPNRVELPQTTSERTIIGYESPESGEVIKVFPHFALGPAIDEGVLQQVRKRVRSVVQVERRVDVRHATAHRRDLWTALTASLGVSAPASDRPSDTKMRVQFRISYTPTLAEIDAIAADLAESDDPWEDVGFRFSHEGAALWLRGSRSADRAVLKLPEAVVGCYGADDLLKALLPQRAGLVSKYVAKKRGGRK